MGISGLLPALAPIMTSAHIEEFRGQTIAIDGFSWLHKGLYSCAADVCLGTATTKYLNFFIKRISMLIHFEITPVVVFDGAKLQNKSSTNRQRQEIRTRNLNQGLDLWKKAQSTKPSKLRDQLLKKAEEKFQRATVVTSKMIAEACSLLRGRGIRVFVAPFEADSQLVFLTKAGQCDSIITEDSDVIVFSIAQEISDCRIIFKLDDSGSCKVLRVQSPKHLHIKYMKNLNSACQIASPNIRERPILDEQKSSFLKHMNDMDHRMFVQTCILSGCDYTDKLTGIGLRRAQDIVKRFQKVDHDDRINIILRAFRDEKRELPVGYLDQFRQAEALFYYQRVFNPLSQALIHLQDLETGPKYEFSSHGFLGSFPHSFSRNELVDRVCGKRPWDLKDERSSKKELRNHTSHPAVLFNNENQSIRGNCSKKITPYKRIDTYFKRTNTLPISDNHAKLGLHRNKPATLETRRPRKLTIVSYFQRPA